ncbi:MAG: DUF488 domain-containing protein [Calditrichaceae bacterium]
MKIQIKRIYDKPSPDDGLRILVDRLWPRGLSKDKAKVDVWLKDIAPSNELRRWYHHESQRWQEFKERYFTELDNNPDVMNELLNHVSRGKVTFLFSSKEPEYNNAAALKAYVAHL